jgi:hypothetical protein
VRARPTGTNRYNRNVKSTTVAGVALSVAIAFLSGCKKDIENQDAVRQGVMNYLSKRADLLAMDVHITSVDFNKDEATATVRFQAKGNSAPGASLTMQYVLERKSDQWVVKGRAGSSAAHGATPPGEMQQGGAGSMGAMPGTALPPAGGANGGALPPGHPAIGNNGSLPPGHPAVGESK